MTKYDLHIKNQYIACIVLKNDEGGVNAMHADKVLVLLNHVIHLSVAKIFTNVANLKSNGLKKLKFNFFFLTRNTKWGKIFNNDLQK